MRSLSFLEPKVKLGTVPFFPFLMKKPWQTTCWEACQGLFTLKEIGRSYGNTDNNQKGKQCNQKACYLLGELVVGHES